MDRALAVLKQFWGYDALRPGQDEIVQSVLEGRDTLALLPTGGGKSICYQLPVLCGTGHGLVISPLIALMADQVDQLNRRGIPAEALSGPRTLDALEAAVDRCVYGTTRFLYVSPERLESGHFGLLIERLRPSLIAIDEAHCISQWGYDFRPAYLRLNRLKECFPDTPTLALTATATPEVVKDILEKLQLREPRVIRRSFVRPNLSYSVRYTENKETELLYLLDRVQGSAVVYAPTRKACEAAAAHLRSLGHAAEAYHAGLDRDERSARQKRWMDNQTRLVVATNAFGMGIDKPDVRLVAHLMVPSGIEAYFQEAGRAGRDGAPAYSVVLLYPGEPAEWLESRKQQFPGWKDLPRVLEMLWVKGGVALGSGRGMRLSIDREAISRELEMDKEQLSKALDLIEVSGHLEVLRNLRTVSTLQLDFVAREMESIGAEHPRLLPLLKHLARTQPGIFSEAVEIDETAIAKTLGTTAMDIADGLRRIDQVGLGRYHTSDEEHNILLTENRVERAYIRMDKGFFEQRLHAFQSGTEGIRRWLHEDGLCRTQKMIDYLGELLPGPCGTCDVCVGRKRKDRARLRAEFLKRIQSGPVRDPLSGWALEEQNALRSTLEHWMRTGALIQNPDGTWQWSGTHSEPLND